MDYKSGGELNGYHQYLICKERGHQPSGVQKMSNPPWDICKYCGTGFRLETKVVERDQPRNPEND